jgi:hypothetical protein
MTAMIAGDFAIQQAVSELLRWSDAQDAALKARIAATAAAHRAGFAEGFEAGRRATLENLAEDKRQLAAEVAGLASRPKYAELERRRWHACCLPCRRGGHRAGCPDCQDRTRATFADPMPDDYLGGPVEWVPSA